jgi:diaminopimelate epimerase
VALFQRDPSSVLDFTVDWSKWLGTDTIATSTWTVPAGITKASDTHTTTAATVWLTGGAAGDKVKVTNRITTTGGRTDERTLTIQSVDR